MPACRWVGGLRDHLQLIRVASLLSFLKDFRGGSCNSEEGMRCPCGLGFDIFRHRLVNKTLRL